MSYYVVVHHTLLDADRHYTEYAPGAVPILQKHGGEVLAAGETTLFEGEPLAPVMVLMKFPSEEAFKAFHDDPDYQPYKDLRLSTTTTGGSMVGAPSYDG
jgi:uncharacterized protein (DUF1330 family)